MQKNPRKRDFWCSRKIWKAYLSSGLNGAAFNWRVDDHYRRKPANPNN